MIILHEPKIIFLKARKVAGTSLEIAFSKYADDSSIITPVGDEDELLRKSLGFRGPQGHMYSIRERLNFPLKNVLPALLRKSCRRKYTQHMSAEVVRARIGWEVWSSYYKVSVIRNPFDYFVSYYCWQHFNVRNDKRPDFCDWCRKNLDVYALNDEQYLIDGEPIIDRFLRFENLLEDISDLENAFPALSGLSEVFRGIRAKGGARRPSDSTESWFANCPDVVDLIVRRYSETIREFRFKKPDFSEVTV